MKSFANLEGKIKISQGKGDDYMSENMTWEEIEKKYPEQWLEVSDVIWENGATVQSAVVKYIGKSSDEL